MNPEVEQYNAIIKDLDRIMARYSTSDMGLVNINLALATALVGVNVCLCDGDVERALRMTSAAINQIAIRPSMRSRVRKTEE